MIVFKAILDLWATLLMVCCVMAYFMGSPVDPVMLVIAYGLIAVYSMDKAIQRKSIRNLDGFLMIVFAYVGVWEAVRPSAPDNDHVAIICGFAAWMAFKRAVSGQEEKGI